MSACELTEVMRSAFLCQGEESNQFTERGPARRCGFPKQRSGGHPKARGDCGSGPSRTWVAFAVGGCGVRWCQPRGAAQQLVADRGARRGPLDCRIERLAAAGRGGPCLWAVTLDAPHEFWPPEARAAILVPVAGGGDPIERRRWL
ncbi:hypothetical protein NDU88_003717 [Pleurodeles waltl]|uniref:Uncharacterized protein n=1 Tax=Pleurodeles waltl TaxID=8319 RepID=A0AAV7MSF6_PLEWA|nr:hypothetical protein NDU88_003717 [Pleurodeles waltl]